MKTLLTLLALALPAVAQVTNCQPQWSSVGPGFFYQDAGKFSLDISIFYTGTPVTGDTMDVELVQYNSIANGGGATGLTFTLAAGIVPPSPPGAAYKIYRNDVLSIVESLPTAISTSYQYVPRTTYYRSGGAPIINSGSGPIGLLDFPGSITVAADYTGTSCYGTYTYGVPHVVWSAQRPSVVLYAGTYGIGTLMTNTSGLPASYPGSDGRPGVDCFTGGSVTISAAAAPTATGFFHLTYAGAPVAPIDLTSVGMPGCFQRVNAAATSTFYAAVPNAVNSPFASAWDRADHTITIPNSITFFGNTVSNQALVLDPTIANGAQALPGALVHFLIGN